jgi:hypothetical protein
MAFVCNISRKDRTTRIVFGGLILLGVLLSLAKLYFIILAGIMIVEGLIGWCGIASFMDRFKLS